jgi:hypothetical protein
VIHQQHHLEPETMTLIECPWCAVEVALEPARADVRCDACLVEVHLAPEPVGERQLAAAA